MTDRASPPRTSRRVRRLIAFYHAPQRYAHASWPAAVLAAVAADCPDPPPPLPDGPILACLDHRRIARFVAVLDCVLAWADADAGADADASSRDGIGADPVLDADACALVRASAPLLCPPGALPGDVALYDTAQDDEAQDDEAQDDGARDDGAQDDGARDDGAQDDAALYDTAPDDLTQDDDPTDFAGSWPVRVADRPAGRGAAWLGRYYAAQAPAIAARLRLLLPYDGAATTRPPHAHRCVAGSTRAPARRACPPRDADAARRFLERVWNWGARQCFW